MNQTNPHVTFGQSKQFRRKALTAGAIAVAATFAFGPTRRAVACWFDPIIFDPSAMVEHVEQVAQLAQQVQSAAQQIANQVQELAHLDVRVTPNDAGIVAGIQAQFDTSLYHTANPSNQLDSRFPTDMTGATWTQYQSDETTWTADERQSLTENRQVENQVYQDMQTAQQQVQAIVDASNSAPGETAAVQAHNDLLSVASAELAKLQALKTARSRLRTEQLARPQSEAAFATAEQGRVLADWSNPVPPTETVVDPFQN
jgi:P-type conjugative transfer protein TrbJ